MSKTLLCVIAATAISAMACKRTTPAQIEPDNSIVPVEIPVEPVYVPLDEPEPEQSVDEAIDETEFDDDAPEADAVNDEDAP